jgi:hypothetical protein
VGGSLQKYYADSAYKAGLDRFFAMASDPKAASRGSDAKCSPRSLSRRRPPPARDGVYAKGATARPLMFIRKWFGDGIYEAVLRRTFS